MIRFASSLFAAIMIAFLTAILETRYATDEWLFFGTHTTEDGKKRRTSFQTFDDTGIGAIITPSLMVFLVDFITPMLGNYMYATPIFVVAAIAIYGLYIWRWSKQGESIQEFVVICAIAAVLFGVTGTAMAMLTGLFNSVGATRFIMKLPTIFTVVFVGYCAITALKYHYERRCEK